MADASSVLEKMRGFDVEGLQSDLSNMPIEEAFRVFRLAMQQLSPLAAMDLWKDRRVTGRLAGVMCVADLRMPQIAVFGALTMPEGDVLTDYDRARTFILKNRAPGPVVPGFYPEFLSLPARERIIALAGAHVGCQPTGQKQANLFSLCGKLDYDSAAKSAQPGGTTCALFLRAVLRACGDARMTDDMLPPLPNMLSSLGLKNAKSVILAENDYFWKSTLRDVANRPTPQRGDLYYVLIPGVLWPEPGHPVQDSGHVGIITRVERADPNMRFESIDGGIEEGGHGWWTRRGEQKFEINAKKRWRLKKNAEIHGQSRILVGFVDTDAVASGFAAYRPVQASGRLVEATL